MNKRIQKKIAKRIINKIGTENLLTDFERKYFIKFLWKPLKTEITRIVEELKIEELSVEKETAVEQAEWLGGIDLNQLNEVESEVSSSSSTPNQARESIGLDRIGAKELNSLYISKQNVVEIKEPNKWNKLKDKVKGWFVK